VKHARPRKPVRNIKKLPRNRRKPNYALLMMLFAASALVGCAASFAVQTPALAVKEVKIRGVRIADRPTVERTARAALGCNILLLRKGPILARLRGLSEVANVKMGRSLPDKVWVRVRERRPDAVLTNGRQFSLVQLDGLAFHSEKGPVAGVPLIEVSKCGSIEEGRKCSAQAVSDALEVLRVARKLGLSARKISVDPVGDMCLNMGGALYVKLGQSTDTARKMSLLRSALVYKPSLSKEAAYIDLSCPTAPVWRPRVVAQAAP